MCLTPEPKTSSNAFMKLLLQSVVRTLILLQASGHSLFKTWRRILKESADSDLEAPRIIGEASPRESVEKQNIPCNSNERLPVSVLGGSTFWANWFL